MSYNDCIIIGYKTGGHDGLEWGHDISIGRGNVELEYVFGFVWLGKLDVYYNSFNFFLWIGLS